MGDILQKIEYVLDRHVDGDPIQLFREDALNIIDLITEEAKDDKVLLQSIRCAVETSWSTSNKQLKETLENVFAYYGIMKKDTIETKMITEKKGDYFIKRAFELKNINKITNIIGK